MDYYITYVCMEIKNKKDKNISEKAQVKTTEEYVAVKRK